MKIDAPSLILITEVYNLVLLMIIQQGEACYSKLIYADIGPLLVTPYNKFSPKQRKAYNQKCSQLSLGTLDVSFGPKSMALSYFYLLNCDFSAIFRVLCG